MYRVYCHSHNGNTVILSIDAQGVARCYRVIKSIGTIDGPQEGEVIEHALRHSMPLKGNCSPDTIKALEGAIAQALADQSSERS